MRYQRKTRSYVLSQPVRVRWPLEAMLSDSNAFRDFEPENFLTAILSIKMTNDYNKPIRIKIDQLVASN